MSTTLYAVTVEYTTPPLKREEHFLIPATREALNQLRERGRQNDFRVSSYGLTHVRTPEEIELWVKREQLESARAINGG